jgi:hypothetical protein
MTPVSVAVMTTCRCSATWIRASVARCSLSPRAAISKRSNNSLGFLKDHAGCPEQIGGVCQDMSRAYLAGVRDHLKPAEVTCDRYHVQQKLSEAIDTVRRAEAKLHGELSKGTRYLWLKQPDNLTVKQRDWLDQLLFAWDRAPPGAGVEVRRLRRGGGSRRGRGVPSALGRRSQGHRTGAVSEARPDARGALAGSDALAPQPCIERVAGSTGFNSSRPPNAEPAGTAQPATTRR